LVTRGKGMPGESGARETAENQLPVIKQHVGIPVADKVGKGGHRQLCKTSRG